PGYGAEANERETPVDSSVDWLIGLAASNSVETTRNCGASNVARSPSASADAAKVRSVSGADAAIPEPVTAAPTTPTNRQPRAFSRIPRSYSTADELVAEGLGPAAPDEADGNGATVHVAVGAVRERQRPDDPAEVLPLQAEQPFENHGAGDLPRQTPGGGLQQPPLRPGVGAGPAERPAGDEAADGLAVVGHQGRGAEVGGAGEGEQPFGVGAGPFGVLGVEGERPGEDRLPALALRGPDVAQHRGDVDDADDGFGAGLTPGHDLGREVGLG